MDESISLISPATVNKSRNPFTLSSHKTSDLPKIFSRQLFLLEFLSSFFLSLFYFLKINNVLLPFFYGLLYLSIISISRQYHSHGKKDHVLMGNPTITTLHWLTQTEYKFDYVIINYYLPQILGVAISAILSWFVLLPGDVEFLDYYHPSIANTIFYEIIYTFFLCYVWIQTYYTQFAEIAIGFATYVYFNTSLSRSCSHLFITVTGHWIFLHPKNGNVVLIGIVCLISSIIAIILFCVFYDLFWRNDAFDLNNLYNSLPMWKNDLKLSEYIESLNISETSYYGRNGHKIDTTICAPDLRKLNTIPKLCINGGIERGFTIRLISFLSMNEVDVDLVGVFVTLDQVNTARQLSARMKGEDTDDFKLYLTDAVYYANESCRGFDSEYKANVSTNYKTQRKHRIYQTDKSRFLSAKRDCLFLILHVYSSHRHDLSYIRDAFCFIEIDGIAIIMEKLDLSTGVYLGDHCYCFGLLECIEQDSWEYRKITKSFPSDVHSTFHYWEDDITRIYRECH